MLGLIILRYSYVRLSIKAKKNDILFSSYLVCLQLYFYFLQRLNTQTFNSRIEQSFSMKSFLLSYSEIDQPFSIPVSRPEAITQAMNGR